VIFIELCEVCIEEEYFGAAGIRSRADVRSRHGLKQLYGFNYEGQSDVDPEVFERRNIEATY
jgi:hypothetical protein